LDAVVVDTETTGLDVRRARIVQIGAVRVAKGIVLKDGSFVTDVDPGEPIPAQSTAVHGIDDAKVSGAPQFAAAFAEFRRYAGDATLIGHAIGFDIAVMSAECTRTGIPFVPASTLDTALLAEIANPRLPANDIEALAAWLDLDVVGRHTALGDALTTARIFIGLVPHLRSLGIRTLGEAEVACRHLSDARAAAGHAGPKAADAATTGPTQLLARIDSFPFRHRNSDLMSAPPMLIDPDRPLAEAMRVMTEAKVSSLFVKSREDGQPAGIVTEHDALRAIAGEGASALSRLVGDIASSPLIAVDADDHVYRAIGRMNSSRIRHLAVVDRDGSVVGALSARDLLRLRASEAITLGDDIDKAGDVGTLAAAWARLPAVAGALVDDGVAAIDVAAIVSREIRAMTGRAAALGEKRLAEAGEGPPPAEYALLVLGSAGRGESLLAADQDNAIVHAIADNPARADAWFAALGKHVSDILHEAGIPYCKGGVMAANAEWRRTIEDWNATIGTWVTRSNPKDLLYVDIFFDLAAARGNAELADTLWRNAYDLGSRGADFAKLLAEASPGHEPPISLLGGFRTREGRVDLKMGGLLPIVSTARLLSIRHHVLARSTPARLEGLRQLEIGPSADLEGLVEIHRLIVDHILRQQIDDIAAGVPPSNKIEVRRLTHARRKELRDALKALKTIKPMTRDLIFAERLGG
jgi:DNA polymerase-3 subunit epsilon/CBS domain-containing protein